MPRKLPWVNTARKRQPPPAKASRVVSDIDDDFFDGTILATDKKGKGRALSLEEHSESDDHNPRHARKRRALSSSPPVAELSAPQIEPMRMALSRSELRDDEWMMVEDELLETANLFSRHLHMAEYDKLREEIEQKKKSIGAGSTVARPVVTGVALSAERGMEVKARVQNEKQRKAFHDVFALQDDSNEPSDPTPAKVIERPPVLPAPGDTDSDDLDAPLRLPRFTTPNLAASKTTAIDLVSFTPSMSKPSRSRISDQTSSSFAKPVPVSQRTASRPKGPSTHRVTPFDMLDDYLPGVNRSTPVAAARAEREERVAHAKTSLQSTSIDESSRVPDIGKKPRRSLQLFDEWDSERIRGSNQVSRETPERLARRKTGLEDKGSGKRKAAKPDEDDIPTFLLS